MRKTSYFETRISSTINQLYVLKKKNRGIFFFIIFDLYLEFIRIDLHFFVIGIVKRFFFIFNILYNS